MSGCDYVRLLKLNIVGPLLLVAWAAAVVAGSAVPAWDRLLLLAAAGGLSSAGASVLNHYGDRRLDVLMDRTKARPLAASKVRASAVLGLGLALVALSIPFSLWLGPLVAACTLAGAFVYVVIYTLWLKPYSPLSVVVGGLAGSFAALSGWFSTNAPLSWTAAIVAALVFLWTPAHFWSFAIVHHRDYQRAGIPTLAVVAGTKGAATCILLTSVLLALVSFLLYLLNAFGSVYLIGTVFLAGAYLVSNFQLWRTPKQERAWISYKLSGVFLLGIFIAMMLDVLLARM
ncbi:MAG: protoheme IX farnesyltransferase [Chloroflexi bacterium]|nr:protoheme IX farnesyltransferase [Chloroflexota bacterium]